MNKPLLPPFYLTEREKEREGKSDPVNRHAQKLVKIKTRADYVEEHTLNESVGEIVRERERVIPKQTEIGKLL